MLRGARLFRFRVGLLVIFSQKCLLFIIGLLLRLERPENLDALCVVTNSFFLLYFFILFTPLGLGWADFCLLVGWTRGVTKVFHLNFNDHQPTSEQ